MVHVWDTRTDFDSVTDQELRVGVLVETKLSDLPNTGDWGKGGSGPGNGDAISNTWALQSRIVLIETFDWYGFNAFPKAEVIQRATLNSTDSAPESYLHVRSLENPIYHWYNSVFVAIQHLQRNYQNKDFCYNGWLNKLWSENWRTSGLTMAPYYGVAAGVAGHHSEIWPPLKK